MKNNVTMEKIVNHLKANGFVFQGSEIYGGLSNSWDYGPLGVQVKNNLKKIWWEYFVSKNYLNVGLDSSIILNPKVWEASGHISNFNDPLIDCKNCKSRYRADKLISEYNNIVNVDSMSTQEMNDYIKNKDNNISCLKCNNQNFTDIRQFTLMFKTNQGVLEDATSTVYLRPETAQGIFINFKNVQRSLRKKIPFGIGQIGKSFRNEITPGNFIFRTREFEQMELEFFFNPNDKSNNWFEYWIKNVETFLIDKLHINSDLYRIRKHETNELAHYSKQTSDFEFKFPFGWGELWGVSHRGNFDLTVHQNLSKEDLRYLDSETNEKYLPEIIEPSVGVERLLLAIFCNSYSEEIVNENSERVVLKLPNILAPYLACITPLSKQLNEKAFNLYTELLSDFNLTYDETGNIGKRYRRQDAIGTPFVITYDFDSENDNSVTIRWRDTMKQERISINKLKDFLNSNMKD